MTCPSLTTGHDRLPAAPYSRQLSYFLHLIGRYKTIFKKTHTQVSLRTDRKPDKKPGLLQL
ncbi:MAG TPA: hypothetical protein VF780_00745 [Nitrosospira sp.]